MTRATGNPEFRRRVLPGSRLHPRKGEVIGEHHVAKVLPSLPDADRACAPEGRRSRPALGFYCGVLGFELQQRMGSGAAFISAGGYHHHIGLNTWESKGGHPPPPGTTGLFHTAILYPTRPALADALHRVMQAGIQLDGASDHGVSEALYLRDPDENGVELYRDRPEAEWPRTPDGKLSMFTKRLDLEDLLRARGS